MAYGFTYALPTIPGTHTDFPVVLRTADFPAAAIDGGASSILNGGGNLRAYTSSAKTTQLPVEVVSFVTGGSPSAEVWVKAPSAATGVTIYIEADAVETTQPAVTGTYGRNAVWSSSYVAVLHLSEDPSGTAPQMIDSTGNGYDGTSEGSMTSGDLVASAIGMGLSLDGTDDAINLGDASAGGFVTVQAWANMPASGQNDIICAKDKTLDGEAREWQLRANAAGKLEFIVWNQASSLAAATSAASATGAMKMFHGAWDGTTVRTYINGAADGTASLSGTSVYDGANNAYIGRANTVDPSYAACDVDEVRVSSVARSADWITAEHANQSSAGAWGTVGSWADSGGGGFKAAWAAGSNKLIGAGAAR